MLPTCRGPGYPRAPGERRNAPGEAHATAPTPAGGLDFPEHLDPLERRAERIPEAATAIPEHLDKGGTSTSTAS